MWSRKRYSAPIILPPGGLRYRKGIVFALFVALVVAAVWYAFEQGRVNAGFDSIRSGRQNQELHRRIELLEDERSMLRQKVAVLERAAQIDGASLQRVKEQLEDFQRERLERKKELAFLRGIVSTDAKKPGLRIQGFKLGSTLEAKTFRYKFTVSQMLKNIGLATGRISITIDGVQEGRSRSLTLKEVAAGKTDSIKMRFRYFQNVEGLIRLPEGFSPDTFNVTIKPKNKKLAPVAKTFDWVLGG